MAPSQKKACHTTSSSVGVFLYMKWKLVYHLKTKLAWFSIFKRQFAWYLSEEGATSRERAKTPVFPTSVLTTPAIKEDLCLFHIFLMQDFLD